MRKLMLAGISACLLGTLLVLPACNFFSQSATPEQKVECFSSIAFGFFDLGSLVAEHHTFGEAALTIAHAGLDVTTSCYNVFALDAGKTPVNVVAASALRHGLLPTTRFQSPTVQATRLGDTCLTYATGSCSSSTPGFNPVQLTWESSNMADAAMTNCGDAPLTGTYSYNLPAQIVVGSNSQQKAFLEPIARVPSGDPGFDTLPPTSDTTSDFSVIAQYLYAQDNISQYFNTPGQPSDSFEVSIPPKMKAHLTIHLLLHYRYGKAVVTRDTQKSGWLWMYIYTFSHDTTHYPNNTFIQQTNTPVIC